MTAPLDLPAIRARADAATEGPWKRACDAELGSDYPRNAIGMWDGPYLLLVSHCGTGDGEGADQDAAFIAAARTDVPALLDEVERLREALDGLREDVALEIVSYTIKATANFGPYKIQIEGEESILGGLADEVRAGQVPSSSIAELRDRVEYLGNLHANAELLLGETRADRDAYRAVVDAARGVLAAWDGTSMVDPDEAQIAAGYCSLMSVDDSHVLEDAFQHLVDALPPEGPGSGPQIAVEATGGSETDPRTRDLIASERRTEALADEGARMWGEHG